MSASYHLPSWDLCNEVNASENPGSSIVGSVLPQGTFQNEVFVILYKNF